MLQGKQSCRTRKWSLTQGLNELDDQRIREIKPLIPPQILIEDLPVTDKAASTIKHGRVSAERIVHRQDDRLLVVVGPCSIHDPKAAIEYGKSLG
jgi:3-deoxy-7-phosphoheptulonate synthase